MLRDERIKVDMPPDEFITGVMETAAAPDSEDQEVEEEVGPRA